MTLGTVLVSAILVAIVAAIILSMIRSHRAGKHIGCDGCGACGHHSGSGGQKDASCCTMADHQGASLCGCASMEKLVARMDADLEKRDMR